MRHVLITALGVVLVTCGVAYGEHSTEHGTKEIKGLNKNVDPDEKDETFRRLFQKRPLHSSRPTTRSLNWASRVV